MLIGKNIRGHKGNFRFCDIVNVHRLNTPLNVTLISVRVEAWGGNFRNSQ